MPDTEVHVAIIKLIIAYTLAGAFVFTVLLTLLSLVGWVKFADPSQQKKLFMVLIVELVIGCLGVFFDFLKVSPKEVQHQVQQPLVAQISTLATEKKTLASSLNGAEVKVAVLTQEKAETAASLARFGTSLAARDQALTAKTKEAEEYKQTATVANQKVAALVAEKTEMLASNTRLQNMLTTRDQQLASQQSEIGKFRTALAASDATAAQLREVQAELVRVRNAARKESERVTR